MVSLAISLLRVDGGTQPRAELNPETVSSYAEDMTNGAQFPPVTTFFDGTIYWLADGFHRVTAAKQAGLETIATDVRQGTVEDARWYSYSVNQSHGLRRTNDDKRRAVEAALQHAYASRYSNREIARHCGVDEGTIRKYRSAICGISADSERAVTRNGATYTMETASIGKTASTEPRTLQQIRDQHADLFGRLSAHGWDSIGKPRQKGMTTFISFRHGGTSDENELAEGELSYWVEQLDESKARRDALRTLSSSNGTSPKAATQRDDPPVRTGFPDLPPELADWGFSVGNAKSGDGTITSTTFCLIAPDGRWETKYYHDPDKAIAEAKRWVLSQPKPKPTPDPAFADLQQRAETFGFTLQQRSNGYELFRDGKRYSLTPDLTPVADTIRIFEDGAAKRAAQAAPVEPPAPSPPPPTFAAFDAVIDAWQRQRSAAVGLVELCCLSNEQQDHNDRLSEILWQWANSRDRERIALVLAEASEQIALPPLAKVDRAAFEAEVRDLLEHTVVPDDYPLVTGMLKAVARYAAMQEATI